MLSLEMILLWIVLLISGQNDLDLKKMVKEYIPEFRKMGKDFAQLHKKLASSLSKLSPDELQDEPAILYGMGT